MLSSARIFAVCAWLFAMPAGAVTIEQPLENVAQEQLAQSIFHELKCVVCEGQALSDSDAAFARDMRAEIRRMAGEGQSKSEIFAYFRTRYGAKILLTPPLESTTFLLWLGPLMLFAAGGLFLWRSTRRSNP